MTPEERAALVERLATVTEGDAYALPWTFGEHCRAAANEITRLSSELAEANAALAWCVSMPPEDVSDASFAIWKAWLSKQPAGYGQAVTRATTPPLAEPPH